MWSLDLSTLRWTCHDTKGDHVSENGVDNGLGACLAFGGSGRVFHTAICVEAPAPIPLANLDVDDNNCDTDNSGNVNNVINDFVLIFGGRTTGGSLTSSLHMMNTKNMAWTSLTEIVKGMYIIFYEVLIYIHC